LSKFPFRSTRSFNGELTANASVFPFFHVSSDSSSHRHFLYVGRSRSSSRSRHSSPELLLYSPFTGASPPLVPCSAHRNSPVTSLLTGRPRPCVGPQVPRHQGAALGATGPTSPSPRLLLTGVAPLPSPPLGELPCQDLLVFRLGCGGHLTSLRLCMFSQSPSRYCRRPPSLRCHSPR
jgi:hypothetical protein